MDIVFDESDKLLLKLNPNKDDFLPHIYKALEFYQTKLKITKERMDEETYKTFKRLFGLVKYKKINDFDEDFTLQDKVLLYIVLLQYKEALKTELFINENLITHLSNSFSEAVEKDDKRHR